MKPEHIEIAEQIARDASCAQGEFGQRVLSIIPYLTEVCDRAALPPLRAREEIARDVDGLSERIRAKMQEPAFRELGERLDANINWPRYLPIQKVRPTAVSDWLVRLSSGREIGLTNDEWESALSRTAGQEWRDISSAPKDGRDIWLWKAGWEKAVVGGWIDKSCMNNGRDVWMLYGGHVVEPTDWQPYHRRLVRPAPPVAEPKETS